MTLVRFNCTDERHASSTNWLLYQSIVMVGEYYSYERRPGNGPIRVVRLNNQYWRQVGVGQGEDFMTEIQWVGSDILRYLENGNEGGNLCDTESPTTKGYDVI